MALFSDKSWEEWISDYSLSHQNALNRKCHTIGIPLILLSLLMVIPTAAGMLSWQLPAGLFTIGWLFQFVGHYYEKKPPEFFKDWRFLFVGARWWWQKVIKHKPR